jgi:hypothetical protein
MGILILTAALALSLLLSPASEAWAADDADTELAKKTQNPIADLISVPFQSNFNFNTGTKDATVYVLNVEPVIPIHLTEDLNLITRTIMPVINQPSLAPGAGTATGLGDINPTFFLSPGKPGDLIWGVGPTFTLPTATDRLLGNGVWSMGPAGVVLTMQGHWVFGALMNNQWSVGGWGDKPVNAFLMQPFVNYNFSEGWYLTSAPILTANWKADKAGDVWTVPLGGGFGKLFKLGNLITALKDEAIGKLPINTQLSAYGNVATPKPGPKWQLRFQIQFLFPK